MSDMAAIVKGARVLVAVVEALEEALDKPAPAPLGNPGRCQSNAHVRGATSVWCTRPNGHAGEHDHSGTPADE